MNSPQQVIKEYLEIVEDIHGAFLDAITGFSALVEELDLAQEKMMKVRPELPFEAFETAGLGYRTGEIHEVGAEPIHTTTQGAYRARNLEGGRNHVVMGQVCLVQIYSYWEDWYRNELAKAHGIVKNDISIDLMGDLRWLRISIVHHRGIALKDVTKCKVLKWFKEGEEIVIIPERMSTLVTLLKTDLRKYILSPGQS